MKFNEENIKIEDIITNLKEYLKCIGTDKEDFTLFEKMYNDLCSICEFYNKQYKNDLSYSDNLKFKLLDNTIANMVIYIICNKVENTYDRIKYTRKTYFKSKEEQISDIISLLTMFNMINDEDEQSMKYLKFICGLFKVQSILKENGTDIF